MRVPSAFATAAVVGVAAAVVASATHAASQFEFGRWMRAIDQKSVSVQRHIAARDLDRANGDARELERLYALMERYFVDDHPADDAVEVSRTGRQQAAEIPALLAAQDYDSAARNARAIAQACNDCHDNHKPFK
jgi:hypothetical protein